MELSAHDLSCHRGDRILFAGVNFSVNPGQALHLAGPNGSGKTTLLRALAGLTVFDQGDIRLNGIAINELGDEYRGALVYVGHLNGLQPELNARENLCYQAALAGGATDAEIEQAIERVALSSRAHLQTKVLSQGQKRRAALARLFLGHQPLWLLDEPVTALDIESIDAITAAMRAHLDRDGILIYSSHQPMDLGNRALKLELGQ